MNNDKRIDELKRLKDKQKSMKMSKPIADYLELNNGVTTLTKAIKDDILNECLIVRDERFGKKGSLKSFADEYMDIYRMSADRKNFTGIILGNKINANVSISHVGSHVRSATARFIIGDFS